MLVATFSSKKISSKFNTNEMNITNIRSNGPATFLDCFSISKNFNFILSPIPKGSIKPIHGLRAIYAVWICVVHVPYFALSAINNFQFAFSFTDSLLYQLLFSSSFVVDPFFTISGIVLTYSFLEREKKRPTRNCILEWIKLAVTRYLRTAPCLWIVSCGIV